MLTSLHPIIRIIGAYTVFVLILGLIYGLRAVSLALAFCFIALILAVILDSTNELD